MNAMNTMKRLEIMLDQRLAGWVTHEAQTNRFGFAYAPSWLGQPDRYALSPWLPLDPVLGQSADAHSAIVRQFFENLLPEG